MLLEDELGFKGFNRGILLVWDFHGFDEELLWNGLDRVLAQKFVVPNVYAFVLELLSLYSQLF